MHHINSLVRNIYKFPSHVLPLLPQHCSPVHSALAGLVARPRSREKREGIFSSPPPIPYSSAVSVAAPCGGAPGCHGFSGTSGHVAHGSVSSIDETRQPRASSIARSRLGLPSQIRVTGLRPPCTERELTGSSHFTVTGLRTFQFTSSRIYSIKPSAPTRPFASACSRKVHASVDMKARCLLSAAPPCPPSMFS